MLLVPRDYQNDNIQEIYGKLKVDNRCLYVAPTGAGKTTVAALVAREAVKAGRFVRFYVHRDRLVGQTVNKFEQAGLKCGVVAGNYKYHKGCPVQIISIQTITSGKRDFGWLEVEGDRKPLSLLDEAHVTQFYKVIQNQFPMFPDNGTVQEEGFLIGLTGTPFRLSREQSLGQFYHQLVLAPGYDELIDRGYLVEPAYYRIESRPGDMIADVKFCLESWKIYAQKSLSFVFTSSVAFAELACKKFNEAGIPSAVVSGKTSHKKRDRIFADFEDEKILVLFSVDALSEGCDIPKARVALFAAFTESLAKFIQRAGRVMRPYTHPDGRKKNDCLILDQMGLIGKFGYIEDIPIDKSVLNLPEPREKGEMPVKDCPECNRINVIQAQFCVNCGYEFAIVGRERFLPQGKMKRCFRKLEHKMQFAFYQRALKHAWKANEPPESADFKFIQKFGRFPRDDWKRNSVLQDATDEDKERYKQYLCQVAKKNKRSQSWIEGQLSLQLGV